MVLLLYRCHRPTVNAALSQHCQVLRGVVIGHRVHELHWEVSRAHASHQHFWGHRFSIQVLYALSSPHLGVQANGCRLSSQKHLAH